MPTETITLLRRLTEAHGVTGSEDEVRKIFREQISGEILTDRMGSIYTVRTGTSPAPKSWLPPWINQAIYLHIWSET